MKQPPDWITLQEAVERRLSPYRSVRGLARAIREHNRSNPPMRPRHIRRQHGTVERADLIRELGQGRETSVLRQNARLGA